MTLDATRSTRLLQSGEYEFVRLPPRLADISEGGVLRDKSIQLRSKLAGVAARREEVAWSDVGRRQEIVGFEHVLQLSSRVLRGIHKLNSLSVPC